MWNILTDHSSAPGEASYAYKQATMFVRLKSNCDKLCIKGLEKCAMYEKW